MSSYQHILRHCVADVLGIAPEQVSLDATLADQGIDSLLGLRFAGKAQQALGIEIDIEWLFDYPSIAELAAFLATRAKP